MTGRWHLAATPGRKTAGLSHVKQVCGLARWSRGGRPPARGPHRHPHCARQLPAAGELAPGRCVPSLGLVPSQFREGEGHPRDIRVPSLWDQGAQQRQVGLGRWATQPRVQPDPGEPTRQGAPHTSNVPAGGFGGALATTQHSGNAVPGGHVLQVQGPRPAPGVSVRAVRGCHCPDPSSLESQSFHFPPDARRAVHDGWCGGDRSERGTGI